jgi:hypothetical protein
LSWQCHWSVFHNSAVGSIWQKVGNVFGGIVAVAGTALYTGALDGVPSHSRLYVMTTNAGMFVAGHLLLGIGGTVVGAIGPVIHP